MHTTTKRPQGAALTIKMTFTTRKAVSKAVWDLKYMVDMASKRKLIGLSVCLSVSVGCLCSVYLSVSSGCLYIYPSIHLSVSLRASHKQKSPQKQI
jgi:hypothetical protein